MNNNKQTLLYILALLTGAFIGWLNIDWLNATTGFVANVYTRLFQLLAVPTIALTIINTMVSFGKETGSSRLFGHTLKYTLLTTVVATLVGVGIFFAVAPGNLPVQALADGASNVPQNLSSVSYTDHLLNAIPNNVLQPLLQGNVLSILLLAFAIGIGLSRLPENNGRTAVINLFAGLQQLVFYLIRKLVVTMPVAILAFTVQLILEVSATSVISSLGKYTFVIISGNLLQIFAVLPLLLLIKGINPLKALRNMYPALLTAFFTKSSAATLPLTIDTAENRAGVSPSISRFVLPICTTINMNGCAAFISVTSLFIMQNCGVELTLSQVLPLLLVSVLSAVGNAGVPMGCYFLTLSLVSQLNGAMAIMGVILPIYTIIDMVETAENVWSDSCVALITNKDIAEQNA